MKHGMNTCLRLMSAALCLLMLLGLMAGCSKNTPQGSEYSEYTSTILVSKDNGSSGNATSGEAGDGDTGSGTGTTKKQSSGNAGTSGGLTKDETKGKTFTIVSSLLPDRKAKNMALFEKLFYQRVSEVEKEYGITVKVVTSMSGNASSVAPLIQAGKPVANICEVEVRYLPALISAGYIRSWDTVPGVNVNNTDFNAGYTKVATVGGKHYGLQFEKPPEVRYCVVMNKNLLKSAGIDADNIYNLVKSKKWTYSVLEEYAKKTTNASKGIYGIGGNPEYLMEMLLNANDAKLVTIGSNGKATPTYTSQKVKDSLKFMNKLINEDKVYKTQSSMAQKKGFYTPDYNSEFVQGKCAFLFEDSWVINQNVRPKVKNFEYGMIPVPLGTSASGYTSSSGHARVFYVTSTNKDLEFTATIFNALAKAPSGYTGDQWWKDEIQLDYFQKNDTHSLDVYMQCLNNMTFDYGLGMENVLSGFKDAVFGAIFWKSGKTTDAAIDGIAGKYDKAINDFFNKK